MAKPISYSIDKRVLEGIIRNCDGNVAQAIAKLGFSLEARTKIQIQVMGAIDTGALLNSVYTSLKNDPGRQPNAFAAARARRPDARMEGLPIPKDNHTAYVGPSVEYAMAVHFGSHRTPGRPFLMQAVRDVAKELGAVIGKAITNK